MSNIHNDRIKEDIMEEVEAMSLHEFQELLEKHYFKALNQKPYDILYDPQFFDMMKLKLDGSVLLDGYRPYITSGPLVEALTSLYMEKLH